MLWKIRNVKKNSKKMNHQIEKTLRVHKNWSKYFRQKPSPGLSISYQGLLRRKKKWKKASHTFCITRILTVHKRLSFEREKTLKKLVGKRRTISALFKNVIRSHVFYSLTFIPDYNIPHYNTYNVFWDGSYKNLIFCTHMIHLWKCIYLIFRSVCL